MNCQGCLKSIEEEPKDNFLVCSECSNHFHFLCVPNLKHEDCLYIRSSNVAWKCSECSKKKSSRGDNTPIKVLSKNNDSDPDSDSSKGNGVIAKIVCMSCSRGFSYNSHRAVCCNCKDNFHFKCINTSKDDYFKRQSEWVCTSCKDKIRSSVPAVNADKITASAAGEVTMTQLLKEITNLREEIRQSNFEISSSMNKYGEWIVENGQKIEELSKNVIKIASDIEQLHQENTNLKKSNDELILKTDSLEQTLKDNVVEIYGVPFVQNEDLLKVIGKVSQVIGFAFNENMVDNCYRYKSVSGRSGAIVVKFVRRMDMENFMLKRREKRNVNSRDLGFMGGDSSPVYVNESLTKARRLLLNAARQVKVEKHYTFLWVKKGHIFMRKEEGDRYVIINSLADLQKLA